MGISVDRARGGPAGAKARQGLTDAKLRDSAPLVAHRPRRCTARGEMAARAPVVPPGSPTTPASTREEDIARLGPAVTALLALLKPMTAVGIGWALLDRRLTAVQVLGAVVVLAAVGVGQWVAARSGRGPGSSVEPGARPPARRVPRAGPATSI